MPRNKLISSVKVNELFNDFSYEYGYDPSDYANELVRLISIWEEQGYIFLVPTRRRVNQFLTRQRQV